MPNREIIAVEQLLDATLRTLVKAAGRAEYMRDQGLCDDIFQIAREVADLVEHLAKAA